jgi:hypothetical protein
MLTDRWVQSRVARWYFYVTKNPNMGKFCRVLQWKMSVYFMAIWFILWSIGIFCGHLVCIFSGHLVYMFSFWYTAPRKIWQPWCKAVWQDHYMCNMRQGMEMFSCIS